MTYDYTPKQGDVFAVVSDEFNPPALLGMWIGTTENAVTYADTGPDEEYHTAPADCVRLVKVNA